MAIDWNSARDRINLLYVVQRKPLHEVEELMKTKYGFHASTRSYKSKIKEWGYKRKRGARTSMNYVSSQQHTSQVNSEIPTCSHVLHPHVGVSSNVPSFETFTVPATESPFCNPKEWELSESVGSIFQSSSATQHATFTPMPSFTAPPLLDSCDPSSISRASGSNRLDSSGRTSLHHAAILGSVRDVGECLTLGAAVGTLDGEGDQALHHAAAGGFHEIVRALLWNGANIDAKGRSGRTPLHMSIRSHKMVKILLREYPTISLQDDNGDTPLHLALAESLFNDPPKRSVIWSLIKSGANVNVRNNSQVTPFHMIFQKPRSTGEYYESYVAMLLENKADISLQTEDSRLPFEVYMDEFKNPRSRPYKGVPATQRYLGLKSFIAKGANFDITLKSGERLINELLDNASWCSGDGEFLRLICNTINVNNAGANGDCLLHTILSHGIRCVDGFGDLKDWILRRGANPNQVNYAGYSPLIIHIINGHDYNDMRVTNALLDVGADQMQRDASGDLPIYFAIRRNREEGKENLVKILLNVTLWKRRPNRMLSKGGSQPKDKWWWEVYESFYCNIFWSSPADLVDLKHLLPPDVAEYLCNAALAVLAESFLERVKAEFEVITEPVLDQLSQRSIQDLRTDLVAILRDCRSLKVDMDPAWLNLLLDLQD